jgi:kumamolisin
MNSISPSILGPVATPPAKGPASDRVDLPGSTCASLDGCEQLRASRPNEQIQVSMILKSPTEMQGPTASFQPMSEADHKQYEATPAQIKQVSDFAKQNGLTLAGIDPSTRTVKLQGSVSDYQKAFGVKLQDYRNPQNGTSFRAYEGKLSVPSKLADSLDGVVGLSNRPVVRPLIKMQPQSGLNPHILPTDVGAAYNFPKGVDGTGQTIGIIEFGGGYNESDLKQYFQKLGIKEPKVTAVSVDGVQNSPNVDNDVDGEVALDIDVAGAVAPGANIVVYFAPDTEQGFTDAINTASHDTTNNPKSISISWGSPEDSTDDPPPTGWSDAGRAAVNNALKDAANLGVNVFVATGDDGSNDGARDGKDHVDFPGASPWNIGVGGTTLQGPGQETGWSGSGGGVSNLFPLPDFQKSAGVPASQQSAGGRGVPDISANADPFTGYDILLDGQMQSVGGTSGAAPLMAGMTALLGQGVGQPLGYLNPFFYQHPDAFNDITSGSNGTFSAGPGWDAVTGLGSPDGTKLLAALKAQAPHH